MIAFLFPWFVFLQEGDQILVKAFTKRFVINGPKCAFIPIECSIVDLMTNMQVVSGPCMEYLGEDEQSEYERTAVQILDTQYLRIVNKVDAEIRHLKGPVLFVPTPEDEFGNVQDAARLTSTQWIKVKNNLNGALSMIHGPMLWFQDVHDEIIDRGNASALKKNQYLELIDKKTGLVRVERGEALVWPKEHEQVLGSIKEGINIDENTAVLIRVRSTGQLQLIRDHQVFVPDSDQQVVQTEKRINLEDYQVAVIVEKDGSFSFRHGSTTSQRSFFLDPHTKLLTMRWSCGVYKDQRTLNISLFDMRPKFMWYEFDARTKDNVELVLAITFFWVINDVKKMVATTDDAVGDVCSHARSVIIARTSKLSMEEFLADFNTVIREAVLDSTDMFYTERGALIHEVEVRSVTCKDQATQRILQEIIKENTNRINRLMAQKSQNEVQIQKYKGDIDAEKMKDELMGVRTEVRKKEGAMEGIGEAATLTKFITALQESVPKLEDRIALFRTIKKYDALESLSHGKAHLYLTPTDVDLRIVDQST